LEALKGKSYWHFAGHGSFDADDARKSSLRLAGVGGRLTVEDLLAREGDLRRPRLVVLSACEAGLYSITTTPDEFIGLPATFLSLGAAGVLAPLWLVDDEATAFLIARFFDYHLGDGLPPAAALKRAQTWLRQATNGELLDYARAATQTGPREPALITKLQAWIARRRSLARHQRRFSHPYYWGGFIHTGL
jgi:CHAT domain-containing protein